MITNFQINFLIEKAPKNIFVFGCTIGLRVSALMLITKNNLKKVYDDYSLKVHSKKTQTVTKVKLPTCAIEIINKQKKEKTLLPTYHLFILNKYFRKIGELAGWTHTVSKKKQKRGIQKTLRHPEKHNDCRFCDHIISHTMRRTAITTLLNLGIPEPMVRKISGYSAGSKVFFRCVQFSLSFLDMEADNPEIRLP